MASCFADLPGGTARTSTTNAVALYRPRLAPSRKASSRSVTSSDGDGCSFPVQPPTWVIFPEEDRAAPKGSNPRCVASISCARGSTAFMRFSHSSFGVFCDTDVTAAGAFGRGVGGRHAAAAVPTKRQHNAAWIGPRGAVSFIPLSGDITDPPPCSIIRRCHGGSSAPAVFDSGLHPPHQLRQHLCNADQQPVRVAVRGGCEEVTAKQDV